MLYNLITQSWKMSKRNIFDYFKYTRVDSYRTLMWLSGCYHRGVLSTHNTGMVCRSPFDTRCNSEIKACISIFCPWTERSIYPEQTEGSVPAPHNCGISQSQIACYIYGNQSTVSRKQGPVSISEKTSELSYRFEIWQAHRQHCCRSACQISERSDNSKYKSRGFETLRDLTERRLFGYWDGAQVPSWSPTTRKSFSNDRQKWYLMREGYGAEMTSSDNQYRLKRMTSNTDWRGLRFHSSGGVCRDVNRCTKTK